MARWHPPEVVPGDQVESDFEWGVSKGKSEGVWAVLFSLRPGDADEWYFAFPPSEARELAGMLRATADALEAEAN